MDDIKLSIPWPAAQRSGAILVQHPAWEEARNTVLDLAAEGPVTVFLTGEPGCGKTWLLRELATSLADHGFPSMLLLRGDLPVPLSDGAAVLVDEAHYMGQETRAKLAVQERGVVVLADLETFAGSGGGLDTGPVPVHLRLLDSDEVGPFAEEWFKQKGLSPTTLDPGGLARLVAHSGGAVRLITQHLTAATALASTTEHVHLTAAEIDRVAALRLGELEPAPHRADATALQNVEPGRDALFAVPTMLNGPVLIPSVAVLPLISDRKPGRRTHYRRTLAATSIAASILAALLLTPHLHHAPTVEASTTATPQRPLLQSAEVASPDVGSPPPVVTATRTLPAPEPSIGTEPAVPEPLPPVQTATTTAPTVAALASLSPLASPLVSPATIAPTPAPALATPASPQAAPPLLAVLVPIAPPQFVAALDQPKAVPVNPSGNTTPTPAVSRRSTPGLMLVAQRGDTLERLYDDIYRDRLAPPFAEILAANPRPFKPGAVVVFPEPIGGWARHKL